MLVTNLPINIAEGREALASKVGEEDHHVGVLIRDACCTELVRQWHSTAGGTHTVPLVLPPMGTLAGYEGHKQAGP